MKKIFNIIGICALMCYLFIFPSCEKTYDEDELLSDIEKKRNEIELKERTLVFAGDTFQLPARIHQIDSTYFYGSPDFNTYTYSFNTSDKEAIKQRLFELTSKLSEYGNFELQREDIRLRYGVTYHRKRVSEENRLPFGKMVGTGTIIIGIAIMLFSVLSAAALLTEKQIFTWIGTGIMILGIVLGTGISFYAMKKYNKGIF